MLSWPCRRRRWRRRRRRRAKTLTFSYIAVTTEDIYLKLGLLFTIKEEPIPVGQVTLNFFRHSFAPFST